jgi:hypothetical protein
MTIRQTMSAQGQIDLAAMWKIADALIDQPERAMALSSENHSHRRVLALAHRLNIVIT